MQVRSKDKRLAEVLGNIAYFSPLANCFLCKIRDSDDLIYLFLLCSSRYSSRNLSSPIKASIHFSLSRSGILSLDKADAVIEITEWVEVPKKNLTVENSTISSNVSAESATGNSSEGNNESIQTDIGNSNTSNTSAEEQASAEPATEKKLKKRTFRVPLKVNVNWSPLFCDYLNWVAIFGKN